MILECIATGLIACGIAFNTTHVNNGYSNDDHNITNSIVVENASTDDGHTVFGTYNWKDEFDLSPIANGWIFNNEFVIDSEHKNTSPFTYGEYFYCLEKIQLIYAGTVSPRTCGVKFYYYDINDSETVLDHYFVIVSGDTLTSNTQLDDFHDLIFKINASLYLTSDEYTLWNCLFTPLDNQFVISYDGYYNFFNTSSGINSKFSVVGGSIVFNNVISTSMWFTFSGFTKFVRALQYDVRSSSNVLQTYGSEFYVNHNIYFSNVKMSKTGYNILSNIGSFSYIRDTQYDDTDFHDLLFSVMDTPIYFFSRMFDFQFFGVNLYIALSGLITLAIVVIIIRKIW